MTSQDNDMTSAPISNWTLATGTTPFERHVYAPSRQIDARHISGDAKS